MPYGRHSTPDNALCFEGETVMLTPAGLLPRLEKLSEAERRQIEAVWDELRGKDPAPMAAVIELQ